MTPGDVVLVRFPFSEGKGAKLRPALVLTTPDQYKELIVAFITSRLKTIGSSDVVIDPSVKEGQGSNLKVRSAVRLRKLVTIKISLVAGSLGQLSPILLQQVRQKLSDVFGL